MLTINHIPENRQLFKEITVNYINIQISDRCTQIFITVVSKFLNISDAHIICINFIFFIINFTLIAFPVSSACSSMKISGKLFIIILYIYIYIFLTTNKAKSLRGLDSN